VEFHVELPVSMVAVRDFRHLIGEISHSRQCALLDPPKDPLIPAIVVTPTLAQLLPLSVTSTYVFRAAVVSIVLTLAVGQSAALLCSVWCHPPKVATGACEHQHQATLPSVTGNDSCTQLAGATAFVREDVRRGASAPDAQDGVVVAGLQFAPPPAHSTSGRQLRHQTPLRASPLILALRI
jgi:hypothetical protein